MTLRMRELAAVAALAVAAHARALLAGFTWLDHGDLEKGHALAPLSGALTLFAHGLSRTGFYRPLVALSLSLDAATGLGPAMFHATNLLFHALAAALVAIAAAELGLERRAALVAGALFAVHPVVSVVTGAISYRAEAMLTAALLAAIVAHRRGRAGWVAIFLLAAGLVKETALVLGPVLVLASAGRPPLRRALLESTGWFGALALRLAFAPAWHARLPELPLDEHLATRAGVLFDGLAALIGPESLRLCDDTPILGLTSLRAWLGLLAIAALIALALRRAGPPRLFALALLPVALPLPVPRAYSPHYFYLPLAFGAMVLAEPLMRARRASWIAAPLLALMSLASLHEAGRYADDRALFEAELLERPTCREGWLYVGDARRANGDLGGAVDAYHRALAPTPDALAFVDRGAALQNLGIAELQDGDVGEAERAFRGALDVVADPAARRELVHDLAAARLGEGHPEDAASLLEPETNRPDALPASLLLRAQALDALGRKSEADALRARLPR